MSYACLFLYCWISVDIQISNPIFLEKGLPKEQDGECILNKSRCSKFYIKILAASQIIVGPFSYLPIPSRYMYWWAQITLGMTLTAVRCKKNPNWKTVSRGLYLKKYLCTLAVTPNYLPFQKPKTLYFTFSKYPQ